MKIVRTFLIVELAWASGIFLLIGPIILLSGDPGDAAEYARWLSRALGLAAFPAGVAVAGAVFAQAQPWRALLGAVGAAAGVAVLVFVLVGFAVPPLAGDPTLSRLAREFGGTTDSWETFNHTAWAFYTILFAPVSTLLYAAIGIQVGAWAQHALPLALRRLLYWCVGLGLVISGYAIFDSTYETIVLHTQADVGFAAFYTLLLPAGVCAGLALPTLALVRGTEIRRSTG